MRRQRVLAGLVDIGIALVWTTLVAASVAALLTGGIVSAMPPLQLNLLVGAVVVVPVTGWLAATEGGRYAASPGKQWLGLRVLRRDGGPLGILRALIRNLVKLALPWLIGHVAVITVATSLPPVGVDVWILVAIAVSLPLVYLATALLDGGTTPYDLVAGSRVAAPVAGRRIAVG